jgi:serine phosphatase RsbU (regulator of sigma subunit)/anti-sigma regulatory factor (Ser/Thr protein kinase)
VDQLLERRISLPGDATSPSVARRFVRSALHEVGLDDLTDDALLLTSELCENAVLHAGTGFELELICAVREVTVKITDHGSTAMELRRSTPRERELTHNRGLQIVDKVAAAWGSRHDPRGHQVWFTLNAGESEPLLTVPLVQSNVDWPAVPAAKSLLDVPDLSNTMPLDVLVTELIRRLADVLPAEGASVTVDYGEGEQDLAGCGQRTGEPGLTVELPLFARRTGRLRVWGAVNPVAPELAGLTAQRVALAIESDWVRGAARERRTWLTYLTEASELLSHSLDVQLTTAMVPQIAVPRLGGWAAVHLLDARQWLRLQALTHLDETAIPQLRRDLADRTPGMLRHLLESGGDATGLPAPVYGVAVPLRIGERALGTLSVGRSGNRAHGPEEIMMITELSRRAAQAIDNAQRNAAHVATAQALQQALLPRALPAAEGVRFAASYHPVSAGAEVGGDFYDVVAISEGRWLAAIGDVCGKGPRAASRTSLVRDVLRVLIRQGQPLATAVTLLHEMMMEAADPDQFATVAVALITRLPNRPALGVELILAGHEQPALVRADRSVQLIGTHGSAVGLVPKFAAYPTTHVLTPGDTLVFYTDGIIERRRGDEQFGQERLMHTLASAAGNPAEQLINDLQRAVQDFSAEPHQDDIAIMAVQCPFPRQETL